jgi:hypothetical protein
LKTTKGQYQKGTSGNPSGRPVGSRNKATLLAEQLLEGEAPHLIRKALELATAGNVQALRLCLDRVYPIPKDRSIELEFPLPKNAQELPASYQTVMSAICEGRITPGEGQSLNGLLDSQAKGFELQSIDRRIQALEDRESEFQKCRTDVRYLLERIKDAKEQKAGESRTEVPSAAAAQTETASPR